MKKNSKIIMIDEKSTELKGFSKKSTSNSNKKTAQDTVPFDEFYDNGLFRKGETFSIIFKISNIDYKVMREDEKDQFYQKYIHFLNTLPQDIDYQELILNSPTDKEQLAQAIIPTPQNQFCSKDVFNDYCNIMDKIIETTAEESCEQIIIYSLSFTPRTRLDDVAILFKYFKTLQDEALNMGVKVEQLEPTASIEFLHHIYHMADKEPFLLPTNFLQNDVNLKDYIVPSSLSSRVIA